MKACGNNSGLDCAVYPGLEHDFSTTIEGTDGIAVGNSSKLCIRGIHLEKSNFLQFLHGREIGKS